MQASLKPKKYKKKLCSKAHDLCVLCIMWNVSYTLHILKKNVCGLTNLEIKWFVLSIYGSRLLFENFKDLFR